MRKFLSLLVALATVTMAWAAQGGTLTSSNTPIDPTQTVTLTYDGTGTNFANWEPSCFIHAWLVAADGQTLSKSYATDWASCNGDDDYALLESKLKMTYSGTKGKYTISMNIKEFFNVADADLPKIGKLGVIVRAQYDGEDNKTSDMFVDVAYTAPASGYAGTYTSDITLSATGGTSASAAKVVINDVQYDAIKAGTSKVAGAVVVTVPANVKTLHFHALGWNNENVKLSFTGVTADQISLTADAGVSANSPFTLQQDPATKGYFSIDVNTKAETKITLTATSGKRFVLFGVNKEDAPTPVEGKYYITGDSALVVDAGLTADKAWTTDAIKADADTTVLNLKAGVEYKLKVTVDGTWETALGYSALSEKTEGLIADGDNNICFTLAEAGAVQVIYFKEGDVVTFKVLGNFYIKPVILETLNLVPNMWSDAGAKMAAWVWGEGLAGAWTPFFAGEGDTLSVKINEQADSVIFVRFETEVAAPDWEATIWNRVKGEEIDHEGLTYTITAWGDEGVSVGQWTPYEPAGGCDWDNLPWLGSALPPAYVEQFKICLGDPKPNVVNIQNSIGTEAGIYVIFPSAAFGPISLSADQYAIQGAGMLLYVSAFTAKETEVSVVCDNVEYVFTVYNDKGGAPVCNDKYALKVGETVVEFAKNEAQTEWEEYYKQDVELTAGDVIVPYNICAEQTFSAKVTGYEGLTPLEGGDGWTVTETAKYDFYLKLAYGADELYVVKQGDTPVEGKYFITGDSALVVDAGLTADKAWTTDAIKADADTTVLNLKAGVEYKLKVTVDGTWETALGYSALSEKTEGLIADGDNNICFTLAEAGAVQVIYFKEGDVVTFKVLGNFYIKPVILETLNLVPNMWSDAGAKMAAWVWGEGLAGAWTPFFAGEGDTLSVKINEQADSVIFVRFAPTVVAPTWDNEDANVWNKIDKIEIDHASLVYTVTSWDNGQWTPYEPAPVCNDKYALKVGETVVEFAKNEAQTEWEEYYKQDVELTAGDVIVPYNICAEQTFSAKVTGYEGLTPLEGGDGWTVTETAKYDFYLKLAYGADELYVAKQGDTPVESKYFITGDSALVVDAGLTADKAWTTDAIKADADTTVLNLKAGVEYKLKVTVDGTWETALGYSALSEKTEGLIADGDNNICFTLAEAGAVQVIYFKEGDVVTFKVLGNFYIKPVILETLNLVPNMWSDAGAKMAAWVWGEGLAGAWTPFFAGEGDTLSVKINEQADSVIFVRFAPTVVAPTWDNEDANVWNKIDKIEIDHASLVYTVTSWDNGQWTPYEPAPVCNDKYALKVGETVVEFAKNEAQTEWEEYYKQDVELTAGDVIVPYNICAEQTFSAKVTGYEGLTPLEGGDGWTVTETAKYDFYLKLAFGADELYVVKQGDEPQPEEKVYTIVGQAALVGVDWNPEATDNDMAKQADGSYKLVKENVALASGTYDYKVVEGHSWNGWMIPAQGNQTLNIEAAGVYNVTFTLDAALTTLIADAVYVGPMPEQEYGLMIDGTTFIKAQTNPATANEYMVLDVDLTAEQMLQIYDKTNEVGWAIETWNEGSYQFEIMGNKYIVSETAKYDFYFKLDLGNDYIYVAKKETPSAIDNLLAPANEMRKVMIDGKLYIMRDGKVYTAQGQFVR